MAWTEICNRKVIERDARIPESWKLKDVLAFRMQSNLLEIPNTCGILSSREIEITMTYDAVDLLQKIAGASYSAEEVMVAFCKRAAVAQSLVN